MNTNMYIYYIKTYLCKTIFTLRSLLTQNMKLHCISKVCFSDYHFIHHIQHLHSLHIWWKGGVMHKCRLCNGWSVRRFFVIECSMCECSFVGVWVLGTMGGCISE